ncbi:Maf family protein [Ancylobacter dichloromethanicus]|uniref:Nucleoside triphosphate pyrophosphatase n=1 Tax=Ancylobacter dichloromethanicus TaxID=518825 RepID=A0A9W6JAB6_9HYPH|nr:Maf family protein [Ancylobacter dichloromethanicus]MBS7554918.1 Maf family protein [Ancylobacter dichloromethanicus]GLK73312.1 Maf-like protein [Ancylobacter dichloromethanicus]
MADSAIENALWQGPAPLVLASKSAARRALMGAARLPFEVASVDVDERAIELRAAAEGAGPPMVALILARAKALAASAERAGRLVIGADQTLALGDEPFHKPADLAAARHQIARLAGRTHALHAAVAVARDGEVLFETVETAHLTMRPLDDAALDAYLAAAGEAVRASVGGYQLEGLGIHLFERVEGDHSVILGLPLLPLLGFLRSRGLLL